MIELSQTNGVALIRINRPDKANALTAEMLGNLRDTVVECSGAKAMILTGTGRVFSAGADLDEAGAGLATSPLWEELSQAVASFPGLSIAALNGTVAGGAFGMVLACDIRLGMSETRMFYPVMKLGFLPQPSDVPRLVGLVGAARAKMILMGGHRVSAADAKIWGLIDLMDEDLLERAYLLTDDICAADPSHATEIKAMIQRSVAR